jgi:hypothetical protein
MGLLRRHPSIGKLPCEGYDWRPRAKSTGRVRRSRMARRREALLAVRPGVLGRANVRYCSADCGPPPDGRASSRSGGRRAPARPIIRRRQCGGRMAMERRIRKFCSDRCRQAAHGAAETAPAVKTPAVGSVPTPASSARSPRPLKGLALLTRAPSLASARRGSLSKPSQLL